MGHVVTSANGVKVVSDVRASRELTNNTNGKVKYLSTLSNEFSESATATVTKSSEISFTGEIVVGSKELRLQATFSGSFTFKNEVGSSRTQTHSVTISDIYGGNRNATTHQKTR